jgi:hypothetical protein
MDPRAGLDDLEKRKFLTLPGLELNPLVVQPIASRSIDYAVPAPRKFAFWCKLLNSGTLLFCLYTDCLWFLGCIMMMFKMQRLDNVALNAM